MGLFIPVVIDDTLQRAMLATVSQSFEILYEPFQNDNWLFDSTL